MIKRIISILMATAMILAIFTGCKDNSKKLYVYNWGEYMDTSLNREFEEQTGIKIVYDTYSNNENMYTKIKSGGAKYDVVIPSDYMIERLISEDLVQKLDYTKIPNYQYIMENLKGLSYDLNNEYSVPYFWGILVLLYNTKEIPEIEESWSALWNTQYKDKILMYDNPKDSLGIALRKLGYSYNTTEEGQLDEAADELKKQKPLVQAYVDDQIFNKMESGAAALSPAFGGDAYTMMENNPDLDFVIPKEGTNYFVDAMCILKDARNVDAAHEYINFLISKEAALRNAEEIGYSTPQTQAYEELDEDVKNNEAVYPGDEILKNTSIYKNLPKETLSYIDNLWISVKK